MRSREGSFFFFGVLFGDGRLDDEFSEMGWWVWFLRFEDMDGEIWSCFFGIFYGFELFFFCVLLVRLLADASVFFFLSSSDSLSIYTCIFLLLSLSFSLFDLFVLYICFVKNLILL